MAQSYTTNDGLTLNIPGTYVSTQVISGRAGTPAAGVVTLIGEADEGPKWSSEVDLDGNSFGPDSFNDVISKYGSGRLVEAFRAVVAAANDTAIPGSVTLVKIIKTNNSIAASSMINRPGIGDYATLTARREGKPGNLIKYDINAAQEEASPSITEVAYTPILTGSVAGSIRSNGGALAAVSVGANLDVDSFLDAVEDTTKGIMASGGEPVNALSGLSGINITAAVDGTNLVISLATGSLWAEAPEAGDTVVIPNAGQYGASVKSAVAGTTDGNLGSYVVVSVTNTLSSASMTLKPIHTNAAIEAGSGAIDAGELDLVIWKPVTISNMTGQSRDVADGITTDWEATSNDGTNITIEITEVGVTWNSNPQVGDTMVLDSDFLGVKAGFYVVVSANSTSVSAYRASWGTSTAAGSTTAAGVAAGFSILKPVIDGLGKSLEVVGDWDDIIRELDGDAAGIGNQFYVSAWEYISETLINRDPINNSFEAGGEVVLTVGSSLEDATVTITASGMTFYVSAVERFSVSFDQARTLQDAADLINAQTDFSASIPSAQYNLLRPSGLDRGSFSLSSSLDAEPGRIKNDASSWLSAVSGSGLAVAELEGQSGLPEPTANFAFLTGGEKGGTSGADVTAAVNAALSVSTNFVVPLFSVDAVDDITLGETESSSTYAIDAINASMRSHALLASNLENQQQRQVGMSKDASFADQKDAVSASGTFRGFFGFQRMRLQTLDGSIKVFQPWMQAVLAFGMQAAAGYKGIVKKGVNVLGVSHFDNSFNPKSRSNVKSAILSGMSPIEPISTGGYRFVTDQTMYTLDSNFVFNSLQAVYIADLMAISLKQAFDQQIVGKSVAEISANAALGFLDSRMFDFRRLRWTAASDDAPKGYKNAVVKINGGVMTISLEAKLAGLIYFVPITLSLSEVSQEASQ